ncbi:MAG: hypothetical protein GX417_06905 [Clostridiales bacterium]|nr:hypothetical protein [Clostridiales bacterium]
MGLFKPKWMNANESVAESAVRNLTKEAELINAALKSPYKKVRYYAVCHIKDQEVLSHIAAKDEDGFVRTSAAVNLKDQELLARTAEESGDSDIRRIAAEKLTNQSVLKKIAQKDSDNQVRLTAIVRLTDEEELIRLVKEDPLRKHAAKRLKKLAAERGQAIGDIVDQSALMDIIAQGKSGGREFESAIMLLEDCELIRLIQQEPFSDGGWLALNQLEDQEALERIVRESGCDLPKKARALGRLLQVAEWNSVDIDDEFLQYLLDNPLCYSDCLKQIYRKTKKYSELIKKLNAHDDHGYRDSCHEDTHYDLSTRMKCDFD